MDQNKCQGRVAGVSFTTQQCEWSMMYDQAMIIKLPDQDLMANFRYEVMEGLEDSWSNLSTGDYGKFDSICTATMMGVLRDRDSKEFSCAVGENEHPRPVCQVSDNRNAASMSLSQIGSSHSHHHHQSMYYAQTSASNEPT